MPAVPTAQISLAETAATPFNSTSGWFAGLGLDITLQLLPFQCSTRLCWIYKGVPLGEGENPTAQTLLEETTATAFSWLP